MITSNLIQLTEEEKGSGSFLDNIHLVRHHLKDMPDMYL